MPAESCHARVVKAHAPTWMPCTGCTMSPCFTPSSCGVYCWGYPSFELRCVGGAWEGRRREWEEALSTGCATACRVPRGVICWQRAAGLYLRPGHETAGHGAHALLQHPHRLGRLLRPCRRPRLRSHALDRPARYPREHPHHHYRHPSSTLQLLAQMVRRHHLRPVRHSHHRLDDH
jgi:hypothetical protein